MLSQVNISVPYPTHRSSVPGQHKKRVNRRLHGLKQAFPARSETGQ